MQFSLYVGKRGSLRKQRDVLFFLGLKRGSYCCCYCWQEPFGKVVGCFKVLLGTINVSYLLRCLNVLLKAGENLWAGR